VPLSLIQRLAHNPASEVIVIFGPNSSSAMKAIRRNCGTAHLIMAKHREGCQGRSYSSLKERGRVKVVLTWVYSAWDGMGGHA
jgi:hypothetical protein